MNIPHLNIIRRLWNQRSGVAQRRLALKKEKIEEANMETHRVSVTVTDPNHTMSTMRKEKIQKRVRVQARDKQHAIDSAIHHYKKAGYKVHDHDYIGKVNEELELEESLKWKQSYSHTQLKNKIKTGEWEAQTDIKPGKHVEMRHHTGKIVIVHVKEETISEGAYEKAEENKRSADAAKKQGDMYAHHLHMADHHDNMAQWHSEKGRHGEADRHAEKSEKHHELAMKLKEEVAANNVGGGNIAGTQGDAGKKPVMNKKPLKRFKDLMEK